jgi:hypothetical protein
MAFSNVDKPIFARIAELLTEAPASPSLPGIQKRL